jgi:uncharacterized protein (DUF305 family)
MKVKTRAYRTFGTSAATAAFLLLAACSGGSDDDPASGSREGSSQDDLTIIQPGRPGEEASTGAPDELISQVPSHADIAFMQMMVPHHAQAVEMAELARRYAVDPDVRRMAARIRAAQGPEIVAMSSWLEQQGVEVFQPGADPHDFDHSLHGHDPMLGMLTDAQLAELAEARGSRFDRLFLQGMIRHHRGAVRMAENVATEGVDVLVTELAADVHVTQTSEIARMREMLAGL